MAQFRCVFSVNGVRIEQIVRASSAADAKIKVEASFSGKRVVWWCCTLLQNNSEKNL